MTESSEKELTFWEHIEAFRWLILRCLLLIIVFFLLLFLNKEFLFDFLVFGPNKSDFITYEILCKISEYYNLPFLCFDIKPISIININLALQFITHIKISFFVSLIICFPYIIIEFWFYARSALYPHEKRYAFIAAFLFLFLFYIGVFFSYFVIFPLSLNFLGSYQVSSMVPNTISLQSYISNFLALIFMMGLVFEIPVIGYFFGKIGILKSSFLKKNRKIAILIILILAAIITPTTDAFTLLLVSAPLILLYEITIKVIKSTKN